HKNRHRMPAFDRRHKFDLSRGTHAAVWSDGTSYCCCATDQICAGGQRRASGVGFYAVGVQLQLILATKHKREFCAQGVYDPCVLGNRDVQVGSKLRPYSASEETMVRELLPKSLLILI